MANDFFNYVSQLVRKTRARAEQVNSIITLIETGFGLLPSKARQYEGRVYYCGADTGAAGAYVVTPPYAFTLTDGAHIRWKPAATNPGASTINVYGLGVLALADYAGGALTGGEAAADTFVDSVYNSGSNHWRIINPITAIGTVTVNNNVKVSANDAAPGVLNGKLVAGPGITLTEGNDGANEILTIAAAAKVNRVSMFLATMG